MKSDIKFSKSSITVKFRQKPKKHIVSRLIELGFSTMDNKCFVRSQKLAQNEHEYLQGMLGVQGLGMAYIPAAEKGFILDTTVPDSMGHEMHIAIRKIKKSIGMPLFDYIAEKLDYNNDELVKSLSCEQIDAVSLAIYNIEKRKQGIIVGDQTGIGKGRTAAALIRYGVKSGVQPIFLSEKPNLFTDLYRDLSDIGSSALVPFIVNTKESKTNIKNKSGEIIYTAPEKPTQERIIKSKNVPNNYNFVCATYSQFNQPKKPAKQEFLRAVANGNIIIMDEAHNASGSSNTGEFMQDVLRQTKGVCFLSATFAKRPDNMPIYAQKTSMSDANMPKEDLVEAIMKGGVALQEVLAAQLVSEGQMIRRERSFEGVEVNYIELKEKAKQQADIADKVTAIIRDIIGFQEKYINKQVNELDKIAAAEGKEVETRRGTSKAGVDNVPYFSKVFNVINQLLFSLNATDVANHAIQRLKDGKKPIIAFASTMGSFLEGMAKPDDIINGDFSTVLEKGLDSVLRYTEKDIDGEGKGKTFNISDLSEEAQFAYRDIIHRIEKASTGITISPLDLIIQKIKEAGYSVGEVTGRKLCVQYNSTKAKNTTALVMSRKKENTADLFRQFNDNEIDCLLINQSGSTGASAHAIVTDKVSADQVKQRVMVILQPELNINTEIQKRGRINRTGQIMKPIYDYIISSIPAQKRFMMMLKKKLKSLDANTTSNQKSSKSQLESDDFLNKYGDKVVRQCMLENPELNKALDNPLKFEGKDSDETATDGDASKVTGRVAVLSVKEQEKFYQEVIERYNDYIEYLKQADEYDLEVEILNLKAESKEKRVVIAGKGGRSVFGNDTIMEKCECNVLKKPFGKPELEKLIKKHLNGKHSDSISEALVSTHEKYVKDKLVADLKALDEKYNELLDGISDEKGYQKIPIFDKQQRMQYISEREEEIIEGKAADETKTRTQSENRKRYLNNFFKYFKVGHGYFYPAISFETDSSDNSYCIFLGFDINPKRKNPYAPSSVKLRFAISDSRKYIVLAASGDTAKEVERIMSRSMQLTTSQKESLIEKWDEAIKAFTADRQNRYIVTGNILQGAADFSGKLVSFTTKGKGVQKGILMSEAWSPDNNDNKADNYVVAPIAKLEKHIMSLRNGSTISTENRITIARHYDDTFKIIMPKTKTHIPIYTDKEVVKLLVNNRDGFEMVSGNMKASVDESKMPKLIKLLGKRFSLSVKIPRHYYDEYLDKGTKRSDATDSLTKEAMELFEQDKKQFPGKLARQKQATAKGKTIKLDQGKKLKLVKLRAKAILIKQKQLKAVAGI
ncbi:strawberry notch-like NTP hydrolase domain-containing protein [Carboxylicivirga marina]|uniref:strawberry notch-like NTP hydrolase domain-containing protein n=1 Tax=Carboxylicivirga marina TaxID=2800988 RepID=UPI0025915D78|nr:strawberry notch C-terminal domain-containing protein [uncultured Carboxylicivirga sp.]